MDGKMQLSTKIARIDVARWDVPMRSPYRSAQRITTTAHNVLVTVTLEDGSRGFGESAPATYVTGETQESVYEALQTFARDYAEAAISDAVDAALSALMASPGAFGAFEIAYADAYARHKGIPLCSLFSSTAQIVERVTDLSLPILPPDQAGTRAAQAALDGFRALKIKVGGPDREEDRARVRAVADAAPQAMLRLDGNQGFTPEEAVDFIASLDDLLPRIEMLEQPTKAGDDAAMAFVSQRVPCPVFADESCHSPEDATRLIESGACAGVVLKLAKSGIRETLAIGRAAHAAGGRCMIGCMMETRVATAAALHVALALGEEVVPMLDLDGHLLVNDAGLVTGGFTQHGDALRVDPTQSGLGLEARTDAAHS